MLKHLLTVVSLASVAVVSAQTPAVLQNGGFENVVQGHGEVVLRGEIEDVIQSDLGYLRAVRRYVQQAVDRRQTPEALARITIEDCGKSRIPLNGLVQELHQANLRALYDQIVAQRHAARR